jgi:electron transfer flavoprotein alpha subunit
MANETGILVLAETADGTLAAITAELLAAARRLGGSLGQPACAALVGSGVAGLAEEAIAFGADKVFVADDAQLAQYTTDAYVAAMEQVCRQASPAALLLGQTDIGRDLAPRLAFRLGTTVAMDCVELDIQDGKVAMTRPCYGGAARAVHTSKTMPQMATVRPKSNEPLPKDTSRKGEVATVSVSLDPSAMRTKLLERKKAEAAGIRLEDAEVVVCGGRGIGGAEGFQVLDELASALGGAVGVTRAVCDMGWRPVSEQIGLTGKVVSPTLYFAIALSGASQHMAGCSGSKNIVAVNKDPEANVFKSARFGIVGDYRQVMPPLLAAVKKLLS